MLFLMKQNGYLNDFEGIIPFFFGMDSTFAPEKEAPKFAITKLLRTSKAWRDNVRSSPSGVKGVHDSSSWKGLTYLQSTTQLTHVV